MLIVKSIFEIPQLPAPLGLTLGTFDGVHLGHQYLIKSLRTQLSGKGTLALLTFTNHPSEILTHSLPPPSLCSLEEKIKRLEDQGVDLLILLHFSQEIANASYKEFIEMIRKYYPFTQLTLGKGSAFGKGRQGTEEKMRALGEEWGFQATYLEKMKDKEKTISSSHIRTLLEQGKTQAAEELLGR